MIGKRGEMWFTWMDFWGTNLSFNTTKMHKFVMFGREMWFTWMDFWGWDIQSLSVLGRAVVLPRLAAPAFSGPSGKKGVDYLDIWHLKKWGLLGQSHQSFGEKKDTKNTLRCYRRFDDLFRSIIERSCCVCCALLYLNDPITDFKVN